jgi:hypothetical protein
MQALVEKGIWFYCGRNLLALFLFSAISRPASKRSRSISALYITQVKEYEDLTTSSCSPFVNSHVEAAELFALRNHRCSHHYH